MQADQSLTGGHTKLYLVGPQIFSTGTMKNSTSMYVFVEKQENKFCIHFIIINMDMDRLNKCIMQ